MDGMRSGSGKRGSEKPEHVLNSHRFNELNILKKIFS